MPADQRPPGVPPRSPGKKGGGLVGWIRTHKPEAAVAGGGVLLLGYVLYKHFAGSSSSSSSGTPATLAPRGLQSAMPGYQAQIDRLQREIDRGSRHKRPPPRPHRKPWQGGPGNGRPPGGGQGGGGAKRPRGRAQRRKAR